MIRKKSFKIFEIVYRCSEIYQNMFQCISMKTRDYTPNVIGMFL